MKFLVRDLGLRKMDTLRKAQKSRDGNIAIVEEFELACKQSTKEAFQLFLARHPKHQLAEQARVKLQQLKA